MAFGGATSGTVEAQDLFSNFKTTYGAIPFQCTVRRPFFDLETLGTGTAATSRNYVEVGLFYGPATLDAVDMDPSTDADKFWWLRTFYVDSGSTPPGELSRSTGEMPIRVRTSRSLKTLGDTVWLVARPQFTGFTALATRISIQLPIVYA